MRRCPTRTKHVNTVKKVFVKNLKPVEFIYPFFVSPECGSYVSNVIVVVQSFRETNVTLKINVIKDSESPNSTFEYFKPVSPWKLNDNF